MPTAPVRQSSFDGGEIAPELYGRTDHPRYGRSQRRMVNCFSAPGGAAKNRPGTRYGGATKNNAGVWTIPFIYSSTQAYVLEFGNGYIRFLSSGGLVLSTGAPYEIASPFTTAMLPYLKWAQVGDVMTLCYGGQDAGAAAIVTQELRRSGHTSWTITAVSNQVLVSAFSGAVNITTGTVPTASILARNYAWAASQFWRENATGNIFPSRIGYLVPDAWSAVVTYAAGAIVYNATLDSLWTSLAGGNLANAPAPGSTFWAPGVVAQPGRPLKINCGPGAKAGYTYLGVRIYRGIGTGGSGALVAGPFGLVADLDASATYWMDEGNDAGAPDFTQQPPKETDPFSTPASDFPAAVAFFEQRRVFARLVNHRQRLTGSRPDKYSNFDVDLFVQDDDAVTFDLASEQADEIRDLIPQRELLALTQSGLYAIRGFQGEPLSPSSIDAKKHATPGSSWVRPARTGSSSFAYVPEGGCGVVEAQFDYNINVWVVSDLTVAATHLFEGHTIIGLAFAGRPHKILWAVRDDGLLLGLTRNGDVAAWHRHTTDGAVENVCVIPEGTEDRTYLVVRRTINGVTKRYHEPLQTRLVTDLRLGVFLDSSVQFDGRNASGTTMKFTADSGTYGGGEEGTILASAAIFVDTDVGDHLVFDTEAAAGGPFRLTIIERTDSTHARAQLDTPLASAFRNVATASWGFARDTIAGLDHLEGKAVMVLGDGDTQGPFTVNGGSITINPPAAIAQIGLAYLPVLELLDVAAEDGKQKTVKSVTLKLSDSRGVKAGESEANLFPWDSQRTVEVGYGPIPMFTGKVRIVIQDAVGEDGRAVIVQDEPLPMTLLAVKRDLSIGGEI